MRVNPDQGLQFAQMLVQDEEPLANINQVKHKQSTQQTHIMLLLHMASLLKSARLPWHMHSNSQSAQCGSLHLCYSRCASNAKNSLSQ